MTVMKGIQAPRRVAQTQCKNCPFCGGCAYSYFDGVYYHVACEDCGAHVHWPWNQHRTEQQVVTAYNVRFDWDVHYLLDGHQHDNDDVADALRIANGGPTS